MNVNVWLFYKEGEDRVYTSTVQPPEDRADRLRQEGFHLYRAEVRLPVDEGTVRLDSVASLVPPVPVVANQTASVIPMVAGRSWPTT